MSTPSSNDDDALTRLRWEIANNFGFPELIPPLVETSSDSFSGRVNLVIHSLQEKWTFGGIATARRLRGERLSLPRELCVQADAQSAASKAEKPAPLFTTEEDEFPFIPDLVRSWHRA